jgi:hypothetical protein
MDVQIRATAASKLARVDPEHPSIDVLDEDGVCLFRGTHEEALAWAHEQGVQTRTRLQMLTDEVYDAQQWDLLMRIAIRKIEEDHPMTEGDEGEWSGSPDPDDPDNFWIDDKTGERRPAHERRTTGHV